MKNLKYFAYGANLNFENFQGRCPGARFISVGTLGDYKIAFNKKNSRRFDLGFANIIASQNSKVEGVIYEISTDELGKLDRYEGYPTEYNADEFIITTPEGELPCWAYFANKDKVSDGLLPTKTYLDNIINCEHLSPEYRAEIRETFNFLQWYEVSKKERNPFGKFEHLWKSFNKYVTLVFKPVAIKQNPGKKISENQIINAIKKSDDMIAMYHDLINHDDFLSKMNEFRDAIRKEDGCYVVRMDTEEIIKFNDLQNFSQFMSVIYQVRSNSVHGEKTPLGPNDPRIVKAAHDVLVLFISRLFEPFL